jgi:superfamily II RNA helicase
MWLRIADITNPPEVENPYPYPLDPFQKCAVKAINNHENVLVTAKTGSGKTLVGEYQIKVSLAKGKRVFYTTPIKSLSNQKFHDLKEMGIDVGILTGDIKFAPQSSVVIMTTEILCNLLFKKDTSNESLLDISLENVDAVVFDEVHYINDAERGKIWEQSILLLPPEINLVMLSATIADAPKFASWIGDVKQKPIHLISTQYRVVPLIHMLPNNEVVMDSKDVFHKEVYSNWLRSLEDSKKKHDKHLEKVKERRRAGYDDPPVAKCYSQHSFLHRMNSLVETLREKTLLPALFFVFNRKKCEEYAHKVSHDLLDSSETADVKHIIDFHLHRYSYIQTSPQYHSLRSLLEKGIAFHHSGLLPILKEIVEILFGKGFIKLLFATETFAVGINMPTKTVVFTSYTKHDDSGHRMLRTDEYIQMAGRAGRRGKDTQGVVLYLPDREPSVTNDVTYMMTGRQQSVVSTMKFDFDFLIKTFYGHALEWKDVMRKTYWYTQHMEGVNSMKQECEDLCSKRNAILLSQSMLPDLEERSRLEENKTKKGLKAIEKWKMEHDEKRWDLAYDSYKRRKVYDKQIEELEYRIEKESHIEDTLEPDVELLTREGYLGGDLGKLAANVHEGPSLLMPSVFMSKLFHSLSREELVASLAFFVEETTELSVPTSHSVPGLTELVKSLADKGFQQKIHTYWVDPTLRWMNGESSGSICMDYGIYEGNFVKAMLKVANLADEWITMATLMCDLPQLELMRDVRQQIVRDVVVPDSLYLRI